MKTFPVLCAPIALWLTASLALAEPALTIYNQEFAVVRDTVALDLKEGVNDASFAGATAQVEADSVILRDPAGKVPLQILEQNYRNDPVSEKMLLSFYEGQTIDFVHRAQGKPDEIIHGKVIRSGYVPGGESVEPIIQVENKLIFELPGKALFPSLGGDNILKPTLSWKLRSPAPVKLNAELAYVTQGFDWHASYNVISPEKGEAMDLVGWITMSNHSGTGFTNARIKLMAGNVNKVKEARPMLEKKNAVTSLAAAAEEPVVQEKAFDEFHLYTVQNPTTVRDKETKQVEFARAQGMKAARLYVYDGAFGQGGWQAGLQAGGDPGYLPTGNKKVAFYREFKNSQENKLGIPLPAGRVRFYQQDEDGQLEFIGENNIEHTPKDETVRLYLGDSFDLTGERIRTDFRVNQANHRADESFQIKLRNHKKEPVEIRVVEHLYRWVNWEITEKSQDFVKTDAQTIEFRVPVAPDAEAVVNYKVRYTW